MTSAPDATTTRSGDLFEDRLCLALYTASRAMTARYRPELAPLGLTYPQYLVMVLLWEDGACSVGRVGARLRLESSTLSPLLKRLEAAGLVTRHRDGRDERSVTVEVTPAGRRLQRRAAAIPDHLCRAVGLAAPDQAELVTELRRLAARLEQSTAWTPETTAAGPGGPGPVEIGVR